MLAPSQEVQDLQRARNLIADPAHWCQGDYHIGDRHCAIGALLAVGGLPSGTMSPTYKYLMHAAGGWHPSVINDHFGHVATLAMFDRAIQLAMAGSSSEDMPSLRMGRTPLANRLSRASAFQGQENAT